MTKYAELLDENGNRKVAGRSAKATENHIALMATHLRTAIDSTLSAEQASTAAHVLHNAHGFTLGKLKGHWVPSTSTAVFTVIDDAKGLN